MIREMQTSCVAECVPDVVEARADDPLRSRLSGNQERLLQQVTGGQSHIREPRSPLESTIMIVDDDLAKVRLAREHLEDFGYQNIIGVTDATAAIATMLDCQPDVVLLDLIMPQVNGVEILRQMQKTPELRIIPTIVLTSFDDHELKLQMLELGANDIVRKPVDPAELAPRVRNALMAKAYQDHLRTYAHDLELEVRRRTQEVVQSRQEIIHCLARAAEFRDDDTGRHVIRVGRYAGLIAAELGYSGDELEMIEFGAQLHDIGKIGIPDAVLLKPGKLTPDEYDTMQKHCSFGKRVFELLPDSDAILLRGHADIGANILNVARSPLTQMAATIALTHHEWWDGSGYPLGLAGEDIPVGGRITAVADVFDALSSKRPYKPAFPLEKCFAILEEGRGTHFDPRMLDAFIARRSDVIRIQIELADIS